MIVQPGERLLLTEQGLKPTASVFVELAGGRLETEAVNSIRHLVANAVQGLQPDQVAVVDQKGRVLSEDLRQDPLLSTASSQMRYRQQVEEYLARKVEGLLLPVVGVGNAVVKVSAEIETEATTTTEERYDPEGQVVRSQIDTEDRANSSEQRSGGTVGVAANTPEKPGAAARATPAIATAVQPRVKLAGRCPFTSHTAIAVIGDCSAMMIAACSGRVLISPNQPSALKPVMPSSPANTACPRRPS